MSFFGLNTVVDSTAKPSVFDFNDISEQSRDIYEETNDDLNDETFGEAIAPGDRNFDFAGQTAQVSGTLDEEQFAYTRHRKPVGINASGAAGNSQIEQSSEPSLQPLASLWGPAAAPAATSQPPSSGSAPKIMSLEEVEAQMLASSRPISQHQQQPPQFNGAMGGFPGPQGPQGHFPHGGFPPMDPYAMRFPQDPAILGGMPMGSPMGFNGPVPHMAQAGGPLHHAPPPPPPPTTTHSASSVAPASTESVNAISVSEAGESDKKPSAAPYSIVQPTEELPPSLNQLRSEAAGKHEKERVFHKHSKSNGTPPPPGLRFNGLMTQWDKNFVMRVQLQQVVTEDPYNEDFYYQVHSAIQSRNNPEQPLNALANTYLFQTGQRGGRDRRGHQENPLKRMQQQVQQAVSSAREHPKREKIQAEGALGAISVGGVKRPKKALNLSLQLSLPGKEHAPRSELYSKNQKHLLKKMEDVYATLLDIESAERSRPNDAEELTKWEENREVRCAELWENLQVLAPVDAEGNQPFILMLSHAKGKKLIPRIFRHIDAKQRLTLLTRIVAHLDQLDVVKDGSYKNGELKARSRESIEVFSQAVLPPLVHLISESNYDVVIGLLDIILGNSDIVHLCSTKIGLAFLTVLISRAELINQEENVEQHDVENWQNTFNTLFSKTRGHLLGMFPPRNVDDSYVWHFLASLAVAARLEHQRVLVDEVREKIFGTMNEAKALPMEIGAAKISNLNLFLNVMGLNATATEITELN